MATILQAILLLLTIFYFAPYATARLTKEEEEKLNALTEISKPHLSIFGKLSKPLKASISVFEHTPETIDLPAEVPPGTVKLVPREEKGVKEIESERRDLKNAELAGINFIQPSLALTSDEQKAIDEFFSRNEQEQLLNLWKSTIERNKTIQFIIQKLTPLDNPQKANSLLSKSIGAAIFLPFYALQAFTDNAPLFYGSQLGGRVLGSVVEGKMRKNQAEIQLSQTEAIILFMMIDEVAERLRQRYHVYKRLMSERVLATNELEEAKNDSFDASESGSEEAKVVADIQRRSVEREVRKLDVELRTQRSALVELAGPQALNELDEQLKLELAATSNTPLDFIGVEKKLKE